MTSQPLGFCDHKVVETLFIPLYARAKDSESGLSILRDTKAAQIFQSMDTKQTILDGGDIATHGILARTKAIDDSVSGILDHAPLSVIINLGVGLDTRISRLSNKRTLWYDIDFSEVICLRRTFFTDFPNITYISESMLNFTWMDKVNVVDASTVIIIAEGVLMYFSESQVQQLLTQLSNRFSKAHMYFDVVHPYFVGKGISSEFSWGLSDFSQVSQYIPNAQLIESWNTGDLLKSRQSRLLRLFNIFPATKRRSQVLHIQL